MNGYITIKDELFYNIRHLKKFMELSGNEKSVWKFRWNDGSPIEVYDKDTGIVLLTIDSHDPHLASYICFMQNMIGTLIKEAEG